VTGGGFIVIALLLALFWLLLIRPQRRRAAIQNQMIQSLEVGDEIVTAGGLYGHVRELGDEELVVEIAPGTTVRIARRAVAGIVSPEDDQQEALEAAEEVEDAAAGEDSRS
jgi:preprotein translocase subunit YajC